MRLELIAYLLCTFLPLNISAGHAKRQIQADTSRYKQIQADTSRYKQIRPDTSRYKQIRPDTTRYKQIQTDTTRYKQIQTDTNRYIQIKPDTTQDLLLMPNNWSKSCRYKSAESMLNQKRLLMSQKFQISTNRLLDNKQSSKFKLIGEVFFGANY